MKKRSILSLVLVGVLAFGLVGCGSGKEEKAGDDKTITIGVSPVPHKEIVDNVVPQLEKDGYKVVVKEFTDYVTPNTALADGSLDVNYFQHTAYLNETNSSKGLDLVSVAEVHLEPMGVYSTKIKNINDIADGARVGIPNDPSNEARALRLLEKAGLIKVKEGELVTPKDITENPKNLKFEELEAAQLPRTLDELDVAVLNGNYALEKGLKVNKDALVVEDKDSEAAKTKRNILAVKKGNESLEKIQALKKALQSEETRKFIEGKYEGSVIPTF